RIPAGSGRNGRGRSRRGDPNRTRFSSRNGVKYVATYPAQKFMDCNYEHVHFELDRERRELWARQHRTGDGLPSKRRFKSNERPHYVIPTHDWGGARMEGKQCYATSERFEDEWYIMKLPAAITFGRR